MSRLTAAILLICVNGILASALNGAIVIPTVPVGNPGNANDPFTGTQYGGVNYAYKIGATEVTNAQYVEFLNAKAVSDPLGLYSLFMGNDIRGGILRSGVSGAFTYTAKPNMSDKPVNYVSWYDAIRFANWVNNGQGDADTEIGAYTLGALGVGGVPINGASIVRNPGATWFSTENEWYKAAYHQPAEQGGDLDNYWRYPTKSNLDPAVATANSVGDISNPGINVVNYNLGADWSGQDGNLTTVGSAGVTSQSFYGTSDQGGNVFEWNEDLISGSLRVLRGAGYSEVASDLTSPNRSLNGPTIAPSNVGFRIAAVPEPGTLALAAFASLGLLIAARRK